MTNELRLADMEWPGTVEWIGEDGHGSDAILVRISPTHVLSINSPGGRKFIMQTRLMSGANETWARAMEAGYIREDAAYPKTPLELTCLAFERAKQYGK